MPRFPPRSWSGFEAHQLSSRSHSSASSVPNGPPSPYGAASPTPPPFQSSPPHNISEFDIDGITHAPELDGLHPPKLDESVRSKYNGSKSIKRKPVAQSFTPLTALPEKKESDDDPEDLVPMGELAPPSEAVPFRRRRPKCCICAIVAIVVLLVIIPLSVVLAQPTSSDPKSAGNGSSMTSGTSITTDTHFALPTELIESTQTIQMTSPTLTEATESATSEENTETTPTSQATETTPTSDSTVVITVTVSSGYATSTITNLIFTHSTTTTTIY